MLGGAPTPGNGALLLLLPPSPPTDPRFMSTRRRPSRLERWGTTDSLRVLRVLGGAPRPGNGELLLLLLPPPPPADPKIVSTRRRPSRLERWSTTDSLMVLRVLGGAPTLGHGASLLLLLPSPPPTHPKVPQHTPPSFSTRSLGVTGSFSILRVLEGAPRLQYGALPLLLLPSPSPTHPIVLQLTPPSFSTRALEHDGLVQCPEGAGRRSEAGIWCAAPAAATLSPLLTQKSSSSRRCPSRLDRWRVTDSFSILRVLQGTRRSTYGASLLFLPGPPSQAT